MKTIEHLATRIGLLTLTALLCSCDSITSIVQTHNEPAVAPSGPPTFRQDQEVNLFPPFRLKIEKCSGADEFEKPGLDRLPERLREEHRAQFVTKAQNRFEVISFSVVNKAQTPNGWNTQRPLIFRLKNAAGTQYAPVGQNINREDLTAKMILGTGNINPDMALSGSEVFDVPKGDYVLVVYMGQWAGGFQFANGKTAFYWLLSPAEGK